jgi:hypothetical protein
MSPDGLVTQTESGSWNLYAALNFTGTHLDGSYNAATNMVLRLGPNATSPERVTAVLLQRKSLPSITVAFLGDF